MSGERGAYGGGRRGGGRGGRGPVDGGRSRGGGGRGGYAPAPRSQESSTTPSASYRPSPTATAADSPSSSSIGEELRHLTIAEPAKEQTPQPAAPPASSKGMRHPARPDFGTVGRPCLVRANHFLVEIADNTLFHYDVSIVPESVSRATNRKIISELVKAHKDKALGRRMPAYDGRKSLYTAGTFPFESKEFTVSLPENDGRKAKEFRVIIKLAGNASIHNLKEFLAGRQFEAPQEVIQALDIVLRESPSTKYTSVARSFFSPSFGHRAPIGEGLECWRGYYQSLRPTQMGLSLNIDISATSFYKPMNVVEFVMEYLNLRDTSRTLSDQDRAKVKRAIRGVRVEAVHRRDLRIRYKINGLTKEPLRQLKFPISETQTEISVVQYFKERYNYNLMCVSWPCLLAGSESKPTYLPMEVCAIVEGQRYSKKLSEGQVTAILRNTCQRPVDRERSIREMVGQNNYNNDLFTKEFGLRMKYELTTVEARVLPPPRLMYHDSGREKSCNPSVGQWNMINKKMVNGASVDYWTCLSFASRLRQEEVSNFCQELIGMCNNNGMVIKPPFVNFKFARVDRLDFALRDVNNSSIEAFKRAGIQGKHIQLLIVILPEMKGYYGNIKRICETELGIVSQCCNPRQVSKCNKQYLENVSLKINVKCGGRNTVLEDAIYRRIPLVSDIPTIFFGADVSHPSPGEDSLSSIAAVVASIDWPQISKYRGLFSTQQHRQEIINDLFNVDQDPKKGHTPGGMIRELLIAFYRSTNQKPGRIIFYRDGVSEGQFSQVLLYEMDAIRKACASLQEGYLPPVTFIVVQKRHHTRLFPEVHGNQGSTDRSGNILPGTVVDRKICHPTEFDFYLCSHAGIQGTSKPTHYHVLLDENKFSANALQTLTNNLCYTYARCTRSVSIVPPAYYAHLVAFRARYYMEGESSETDSGPSQTRDAPIPVQFFPRVKDQVKDVMFYC
ncbi:protein argonaute MEL1-like isoform X2 [Zingiber officinale]|uniref:protein argonaute MEL1-like isoform X2 n=1 Tax=Zingiber officinale TaxID=94328 RepID=UPI001C4C1350|nr:protein argonaute MEL1-like isoform X2 [Zingiber officinale]